jgi:hypothetical protein
MTVLARSKSGDKFTRRRSRRLPLGGFHQAQQSAASRGQTTEEPDVGQPAAPEWVAPTVSDARATAGAPLVLDHAGRTQDRATYTCGCGYVFEAQVLTTVSCPNCHCEQAW